MDLKELGSLLKEERIKQGKTLEEIAETTKISRRSLYAIEEGIRSNLPHPVYARGFIRSYANMLRVDPDVVSAVLVDEFPVEEETFLKEKNELNIIPIGDDRGRNYNFIRVIIGVLLIIVVTAGLLWYLSVSSVIKNYFSDSSSPRKEDKTDFTPSQPSEPAKDDIRNTPQSAQTSESGVNRFAGDPPPIQTADNQEAIARLSAPPSFSAEGDKPKPDKQDKEKVTDTGKTNVLNATVKTGEGGKQIDILAKEPCWIMSKPDDGTPRQDFLYRSERVVLKFSQKIWLKLGNAGGVTILYDGKPYPIDAKSGDVRELTIP